MNAGIREIPNTKLVVKPIGFSCDVEMKNIEKPLMSKAFFYMLIGKPASGKSTMLLNLIANKKMYKKKFHRIYCVSPSLCGANSTLEDNPLDELDPSQIYDELNLEVLTEIYEKMLGSQERILLVLDDIQNDIKSCERLMKKIIMNRRHIPGGGGGFVSIVMTSQVLNNIPLSIRKQTDIVFMWQTRNEAELRSLQQEFLASFTREQLARIWAYVYRDIHDVLIIRTNDPPEDMLYRNFNKLVLDAIL